MNKIIPLILLIAGLGIMVIGINATQSFSSDLSRIFTGMATDKAVFTVILGSVVSAVGLVLIVRTWRRA